MGYIRVLLGYGFYRGSIRGYIGETAFLLRHRLRSLGLPGSQVSSFQGCQLRLTGRSCKLGDHA